VEVKVFMTALGAAMNHTVFLGMVRVDGQPEWASGEGRFILEADYIALHSKYEYTVRILSETESYVAKLEAQLRERT
jgi:hypothetical protein